MWESSVNVPLPSCCVPLSRSTFFVSQRSWFTLFGKKKPEALNTFTSFSPFANLFDGNLLGRWFYLRFGISSQFPELRYKGGRAILNHGCLPLSVPQIGASEQCIVAFLPSRQCLEPAHSFHPQRILKKWLLGLSGPCLPVPGHSLHTYHDPMTGGGGRIVGETAEEEKDAFTDKGRVGKGTRQSWPSAATSLEGK